MRDSRVAPHHLSRDAYLYIRQSTLRQVNENGESTRRQYALRERAIALGWPPERIHIIDQDIGLSGAHSEGRDGFQDWLPPSACARSASYSVLKYRGWRATRLIGNSYSSSVLIPIR